MSTNHATPIPVPHWPGHVFKKNSQSETEPSCRPGILKEIKIIPSGLVYHAHSGCQLNYFTSC